MKTFNKFYYCTLIGILAVSIYPLYMGVKVISDMIRFGTVYAESYPKYIIPYTPIAFALIIGVAVMPLVFRIAKRFVLLIGSAVSVSIFFITELLFESHVIVTTTVEATLESWQMYMCYQGYGTSTLTEVNILMGEYSPTFKIHFYVISIIIVLSVLNCIYGFAEMIKNGDTARKKALIIQAVSSVIFIGLCIFACFTAFFRTGDITVSAVSAILMAAFFMIMGIVFGIFIASFLLRKRKVFSVVIPSIVAIIVVLTMYIGEMFLLSGHLYRFGNGLLFDGLGIFVLAPIDIVIILASGVATFVITKLLNMEKSNKTDKTS